MHLHVNCACTIDTCLNQTFVCCSNGVVLQLRRTTASQNRYSGQFTDKQAERGYYSESDVLCVK